MGRIDRRTSLMLAATMAVGLLGCGEAAPREPTRERPRLDKQALFGDPGLVPTREGERARRELALATSLVESLELIGVSGARVEVALGGGAPRVVIVARLPRTTQTELDALTGESEALALAMVPGLDAQGVHVLLRAETEADAAIGGGAGQPSQAAASAGGREKRRGRAAWGGRELGLGLALFGLGLSLGQLIERARRRRALRARSGSR
ncbi:hypothetical protein G6O69_23885 [Pseudenhygromyxa sp. WMMC2535]|uniref:hypothetical protein n=1 Tax=Pseudenhygromyxa sp. WMMC2535 TaxID=2712867 RepID=UPI001595802D|nr:hypothetical protein [Pseudenhygromyxa sp. WMMC2535]NVB40901.1 hypothetical protein [Pseudenhygromyxa sp. WMMC2535]